MTADGAPPCISTSAQYVDGMADVQNMTEIRRGEHGRWLPGSTGNPHGRPRAGRTIAETARAFMTAARRRALIEALYEMTIRERNVGAARLLLAYTDGPAVFRDADGRPMIPGRFLSPDQPEIPIIVEVSVPMKPVPAPEGGEHATARN